MNASTRIGLLCGVMAVSGCALTPEAEVARPVPDSLPLVFTAQDKIRWESMALPGKLRSTFRVVQQDGRVAVQTEPVGSIGMLRQKLRIPSQQLHAIQFEWRASNLIDGADMTQRESEDSPVRVVLAFDGDRSRFSARNAMLNELTRSITGEEMPYAVLMYVWSNDQPVGTVITNPRTDRIRKIVLESGPARLGQWLRYERDVYRDFEQAFGEAPGMLQSIAIMSDTDNTRGHTLAGYGDIRLEKRRD